MPRRTRREIVGKQEEQEQELREQQLVVLRGVLRKAVAETNGAGSR